jgi:hypothetical protein
MNYCKIISFGLDSMDERTNGVSVLCYQYIYRLDDIHISIHIALHQHIAKD